VAVKSKSELKKFANIWRQCSNGGDEDAPANSTSETRAPREGFTLATPEEKKMAQEIMSDNMELFRNRRNCTCARHATSSPTVDSKTAVSRNKVLVTRIRIGKGIGNRGRP